jgi:hypothetical protein
MNSVIKISALLGLAVAGLFAAKSFATKLSAVRTVIHSGVLEKIEYTTKHSSMPSYAGGTLSASQVVSDVTVVFMQDGTQVLINDKIDVLFAKGARVRVEQDGFGRRFLVEDVAEVSGFTVENAPSAAA